MTSSSTISIIPPTLAPSFLGVPLSATATVWVAPVLPVLLSCCQVTNVLSYHLMAPLLRIFVKSVASFIFIAEVASDTVATIMFLSMGTWDETNSNLPHLSMESTVAKVDKLTLLLKAATPPANPATNTIVLPLTPAAKSSGALGPEMPPGHQ